jgi:sec-independent protein translocase protein TatA
MGLENPIHIVLLLVVLLLVFGAKRLPEMGRGLGDGLRGFKEAVSGQTPAHHTLSASEPGHDGMVATVATPAAEPVAAAVVVEPAAVVVEPMVVASVVAAEQHD